MRISSQMQNSSFINMQTSDTYKNYLKKDEDNDKTKDTKDIKHVTNNVVVEKKEDLYILSKVDEKDKQTILSEVKANTKIGLELSNYFKTNESTDLKSKLNQVNQTINSMSLVDYI